MEHAAALQLAREAVASLEAAGVARPRLAAWLLTECDPRPPMRRRRYRPSTAPGGGDVPCCWGTALYDDHDRCTCPPWAPAPVPLHDEG